MATSMREIEAALALDVAIRNLQAAFRLLAAHHEPLEDPVDAFPPRPFERAEAAPKAHRVFPPHAARPEIGRALSILSAARTRLP